MAMCPSNVGKGVFQFDIRGQNAVVALGVYFLESGLQVRTADTKLRDKCIPLLVNIIYYVCVSYKYEQVFFIMFVCQFV